MNVCLVSGEIQVKRGDKGNDQGLLVELLLTLVDLLLVVLEKIIDSVEDALGVVADRVAVGLIRIFLWLGIDWHQG